MDVFIIFAIREWESRTFTSSFTQLLSSSGCASSSSVLVYIARTIGDTYAGYGESRTSRANRIIRPV